MFFVFLALQTSQDADVAPAEAEAVSENTKGKKSEETSPFVSSAAASPVTNGSIIASNGNESEATNRNTSTEDSANDDLIDAIIANAVAAVNGEVISAGAINMCPESLVSPTEGQLILTLVFVVYLSIVFTCLHLCHSI